MFFFYLIDVQFHIYNTLPVQVLFLLRTSYKNTQHLSITSVGRVESCRTCKTLYDKSNCLCACTTGMYVLLGVQCRSSVYKSGYLVSQGVTSLILILQATLCSQGLAAGCNEAHPVFEVLRKLWTLDLLRKIETTTVESE